MVLFVTRCIISSFKEQQELSMMLKVGLIRIGMLSSHHACELFARCFRTIWTVGLLNRKSRYSFIYNNIKGVNSDLDLKEYLTILIVSGHVRSALSGKCGILDTVLHLHRSSLLSYESFDGRDPKNAFRGPRLESISRLRP